MPTYPAISLWQPYATLIVIDAKLYETRHWPAPKRLIGQRVAIHAAARKITRDEAEDWEDSPVPLLLGDDWLKSIPYGAIVGTAVLASCHVVQSYDGKTVVLDDQLGTSFTDDGFGDYEIGRWRWRLTDARPITPAVPAKGQRGLFRWIAPAELVDAS